MTGDDPREYHAIAGGSTSRSLLAEAKLADPAAWERLAKLYAPLVAFWCRRWGVADQDVVDVLQDVFSAVASHLPGFPERAGDTFRGWLLTIARNKTRDYFRRRARRAYCPPARTEATLRLHQIADPQGENDLTGNLTAVADDATVDGVLSQAHESIRGEFHERTWRAFWGVVVEGRAVADVAADLDMRPGTVRVSKSRVLLRLRNELGDIV